MNQEKAAATVVVTGGGTGVGGALLVAFVVLKLTGYIGWSWWWVLAPFWIPLVMVTAVAVFIGVVVAVLSFPDRDVNRRAADAAVRRRRRLIDDIPGPHEHGPRHRWGRP